jgi:hypothetical protein
MNFSEALKQLKAGKQIHRAGWNAHHRLGLQTPDEHSANTAPYIFMVIGENAKEMQGKRLPWVCSQTDMLAEDWLLVK